MPEPLDAVEIERVIVKAVERHARGNPEALARPLVADLRRAGFEIRRTDATPVRPRPRSVRTKES
jgi:hypothetical protein